MTSAIPILSNRRWTLVANLIALVLLGFAGTLLAQRTKQPFLVSVVPTASLASGGTISMAHKGAWTFYVVLTNISNEPQTVWEEGSSWGYQVISFEVVAPNGQNVVISKQPQAFTKNTPRTFIVRPGEQKVYEVRLDDDWTVHPALAKIDEMTIKLKANYNSSPTPEATKLKVFVGHVESKSYDLLLRQW